MAFTLASAILRSWWALTIFHDRHVSLDEAEGWLEDIGDGGEEYFELGFKELLELGPFSWSVARSFGLWRVHNWKRNNNQAKDVHW